MSQSEAVDVTSSEEDTYTSSSIAKFSWYPDSLDENGFLQIEFQDGSRYLYMDVPESLSEGLKSRAKNPEDFEDSVGQFFLENIRYEYQSRGEDYTRL